jgi:hypothetical protein
MANPTQIGELKLLGLQSYKYLRFSNGAWAADGQSYTDGAEVYTGFVIQSATVNGTAEEEEHTNEDGETKTIVLENPGTEVSIEVVFKDAADDPTPPVAIGTRIELSATAIFTASQGFRVTAAPITLGKGKEAVKMSITAKRETSMAAIYDA